MNQNLGPTQAKILNFLQEKDEWVYTWEIQAVLSGVSYDSRNALIILKRLHAKGYLAYLAGPGVNRNGQPRPKVYQWRVTG